MLNIKCEFIERVKCEDNFEDLMQLVEDNLDDLFKEMKKYVKRKIVDEELSKYGAFAKNYYSEIEGLFLQYDDDNFGSEFYVDDLIILLEIVDDLEDAILEKNNELRDTLYYNRYFKEYEQFYGIVQDINRIIVRACKEIDISAFDSNLGKITEIDYKLLYVLLNELS